MMSLLAMSFGERVRQGEVYQKGANNMAVSGSSLARIIEITSGSSFEPNNLTEQKLGYA